MRNTFLAKLYRTDKILFLAAVLYIGGVLYYSLRQREEFPFLLYGMYSLKESPQQTYTTYSIELNGQEVDYSKICDSKRELIAAPLGRLAPAIDSGTLSIHDNMAFQGWLLHQFFSAPGPTSNQLEVYKQTCGYNAQGKPVVFKKQMLFTYASQ